MRKNFELLNIKNKIEIAVHTRKEMALKAHEKSLKNELSTLSQSIRAVEEMSTLVSAQEVAVEYSLKLDQELQALSGLIEQVNEDICDVSEKMKKANAVKRVTQRKLDRYDTLSCSEKNKVLQKELMEEAILRECFRR